MADFAAEVRRLMAERGMSLRGLARTAGYDPSYLSKILSGRKPASPYLAARLDDALGAEGKIREAAASVPDAPRSVPGEDLGLIELARRAEVSDLGDGTLELLQASADRLGRDYPTVDPRVLSGQTRTHLGYVTDLLGKRVTLAQHRELLVTAGWLSALLACTCYDAGDPGAAETARRMTRQFGQHAEHGELIAWSFEIAAWYALVEGRFARAVTLCEAGLAHAGISNAAVQLTLQASRAYARMGDDRAGKMLAAGGAVLARLPVPAVAPAGHRPCLSRSSVAWAWRRSAIRRSSAARSSSVQFDHPAGLTGDEHHLGAVLRLADMGVIVVAAAHRCASWRPSTCQDSTSKVTWPSPPSRSPQATMNTWRSAPNVTRSPVSSSVPVSTTTVPSSRTWPSCPVVSVMFIAASPSA
jgi:transcriptional regulator with XRE-family HTH domain